MGPSITGFFFYQYVPLALQNSSRRKTAFLGQIFLIFIIME